jgi:hypothetical protein
MQLTSETNLGLKIPVLKFLSYKFNFFSSYRSFQMIYLYWTGCVCFFEVVCFASVYGHGVVHCVPLLVFWRCKVLKESFVSSLILITCVFSLFSLSILAEVFQFYWDSAVCFVHSLYCFALLNLFQFCFIYFSFFYLLWVYFFLLFFQVLQVGT